MSALHQLAEACEELGYGLECALVYGAPRGRRWRVTVYEGVEEGAGGSEVVGGKAKGFDAAVQSAYDRLKAHAP
jgi:hypothetical protein